MQKQLVFSISDLFMYLDLVDGCIRNKQSRGDSSSVDTANHYLCDFGNH